MAKKDYVIQKGLQVGNVQIAESGDISTSGNINLTSGSISFSTSSGTAGYYLRSDGTSVTLTTLRAGDLTGTVAIAAGGTGQTTATAAFNALAPSQAGHGGKFLTTNGASTSWANVVTPTSTDTLSNKTFSAPLVNSPVVKGEKTVVQNLGTLSSGTTTIDLSAAQIYTAVIASAAMVTFAFTNPPSVNQSQMIVLRLTNAGAGTLIWPTGTKYAGGALTQLTTSGVDVLGVFYDPVSATYMVFVLGRDMK